MTAIPSADLTIILIAVLLKALNHIALPGGQPDMAVPECHGSGCRSDPYLLPRISPLNLQEADLESVSRVVREKQRCIHLVLRTSIHEISFHNKIAIRIKT